MRREQIAGRRRGRKIRHVLQVDVDRIQKPAVGGMVRARPVALAAEQRVQRVEPDGGAACPRRRRGDLLQRREVADPLVAVPAQRVQMRGETEAALSRAQFRGQMAAPRRHRALLAARSELIEAFPGLGRGARVEVHRCEQRVRGVGADHVAAPGHVMPFGCDSRGCGEAVEDLRLDTGASGPPRRLRLFDHYCHRPRRDLRGAPCERERRDRTPRR
jgi:hypothetical protein